MCSCFSKKDFDCLDKNKKDEYLKNYRFFCSCCNRIYNLYLIEINEEYDKTKTYYSLFLCKYHKTMTYPSWYS